MVDACTWSGTVEMLNFHHFVWIICSIKGIFSVFDCFSFLSLLWISRLRLPKTMSFLLLESV